MLQDNSYRIIHICLCFKEASCFYVVCAMAVVWVDRLNFLLGRNHVGIYLYDTIDSAIDWNDAIDSAITSVPVQSTEMMLAWNKCPLFISVLCSRSELNLLQNVPSELLACMSSFVDSKHQSEPAKCFSVGLYFRPAKGPLHDLYCHTCSVQLLINCSVRRNER